MKSRAAESLVLALYAVVVISTTLHHEPWRDEADSWLLVRDASFTEIVEIMPYAGTPALWYAVLYPFAKAGLPFLTQSLINNAFMIAAAALVLFFSPLPKAANIALIFGYYPMFEYAVVARSYGLSVLLAVCALALWRSPRPIAFAVVLGLLANTNTHSLLLSLVLAGAWIVTGRRLAETMGRNLPDKMGEDLPSKLPALVERRLPADHPNQPPRTRLLIATLLYALLVALALWQIRPPGDGNLAHSGRPVLPEYAPEAVAEAFFPFVPVTSGAVLGLLVLAALTVRLWRDRAASFVLWAAAAGLMALFVFVWVGGRRHYGLIALAALAALWIAKPQRWPRWAAIALASSMTWSAVAGAWTVWREWREPYSGAKEVAEFIERSGLEDLPIAGHPAPQSESILPYFDGRKIWYAGIADWGTYQKWDARFEEGQRVSYPEAVARARRQFEGRRFLLLLNVEMPDPAGEGFRLVYRSDRMPFGIRDERYSLYERR